MSENLRTSVGIRMRLGSFRTRLISKRIARGSECRLGLLFVFLLGSPAFADPGSCLPSRAMFASRWQSGTIEESKKLTRHEFAESIFPSPSDSLVLKQGTELNAVIDTSCLLDAARGPRNLPWLHKLKQTLRPRARGSALQSTHWNLERDWDFERLQAALEEEPCVQMVSPEGRFFLNRSFNDPFIKDQEHLTALGFDQAMDSLFLPLLVRKPVTIAIVDTGVDLAHMDLQFNRWVNSGEIPGNGRDDDGNGWIDDVNGYNFASDVSDAGPQGHWPDNRHGTHVAGLAAARMDNAQGGIGVHGLAKIMSLNVFGLNGFTRSSILENAIRYAADQGVDIINLSLGGREYSRTMRTALQYAVRHNVFIVTAAGNDGMEICDDPQSFEFISPAVYGSTIEGMIVTGSVDASTGRLSSFSNFSPRLVEIAAPGAYTSQGLLVGLLSTTPGNTYTYLAGTSMATPIVSGAAALAVSWLKAYRYDVTPKRLEQILKEASRIEPTLAPSIQGSRSLDLRELVRKLKKDFPSR